MTAGRRGPAKKGFDSESSKEHSRKLLSLSLQALPLGHCVCLRAPPPVTMAQPESLKLPPLPLGPDPAHKEARHSGLYGQRKAVEGFPAPVPAAWAQGRSPSFNTTPPTPCAMCSLSLPGLEAGI